ncbi:MAG TPA: hypothetical protein ACFE0H_03500, partial [Elainellaceae cyanobacterium]
MERIDRFNAIASAIASMSLRNLSAMLMLVTRSYAGEKDLESIVNLLNDCEVVDCLDEYHTVSDLQMEFSAPHVDPDRDLR